MIPRLLTVAVLLTLPTVTSAQRKQPWRQPIIDVHMHNYSTDELLKSQAPNPLTGIPNGLVTDQAHMRATLAAMERYNIVKGVVSNNHAVGLRWRAAAPDRVIISYSFDDPSSPDLDVLRKEVAAGRLQALGEVGSQYEGILPNDPRFEPLFALAEQLDIPFAIHMGLGPPGAAYIGYPKYRMGLSNPLLLEEVLIRHPKLRLYVMHAGWPMLDQMIGLMWAHPQVYVDIGAIDWAIERKEFHFYLRRLVEAGFGKRIMFGSDQMVWPEVIGRAIEGVKSATFLTPKQKADIFYNNAAEFLRLDKNVKTRISAQRKPQSNNTQRMRN
jgi:predicted TIM-barrel fold metal-dependent hydrolase